jgi:hypothetical protein
MQQLNADDIALVTQDVWHARERVKRNLLKDHPDRRAVVSELKRILSRASPQYSGQITADSPAELLSKVEQEEAILKSELYALVDKYRSMQARTLGTYADRVVSHLGAALLSHHPASVHSSSGNPRDHHTGQSTQHSGQTLVADPPAHATPVGTSESDAPGPPEPHASSSTQPPASLVSTDNIFGARNITLCTRNASVSAGEVCARCPRNAKLIL